MSDFSKSENYPLFQMLEKIFEEEIEKDVKYVDEEGNVNIILDSNAISFLVERLRYETDDNETYLNCLLGVFEYLDIPFEEASSYISDDLKQKIEMEEVNRNTVKGRKVKEKSILEI